MTPEREQRLKKVLDKRQDDLTVVLENVLTLIISLRLCELVMPWAYRTFIY